jgi:hypothetical protein
MRIGLMVMAFAAALSGSHAVIGQGLPSTRIPDDTDWWSTLRTDDEVVKPEERELTKSNFRIAGIDLNEKMFDRAVKTLGKATEVDRGDASTGRHQLCYVSKGAKDKIYLIFEMGEVDFNFYLFEDGKIWSGMEQCVASSLITSALGTASGLQLGQAPSKVKAILGVPSKQTSEEWVYSFSVQKKASAKDLQHAQQENPRMSKEEIEKNYGSYALGTGAVVKFRNGRVVYLNLSLSETL